MSINEPRQARSRITMERFVTAALGLIEQKPWSSITVAELARAAGSSVGAFYARFGDKDTLLKVLDDFYVDSLSELLEQFSCSRPDTLKISAHALLERLTEFHERHAGLVRTLVLEARRGGEVHFAENSRRLSTHLPGVVDRFMAATDLPPAIQPRHVRYAVAFTYSALREQTVFPEAVPVRILSRAPLVAALTASFVGTVQALAAEARA